MDFVSAECESELFQILFDIDQSDSEDFDDEPETPGGTTGDESSDTSPSYRWPEEQFPRVLCRYFKEGYEKRTEKKYMIRLYWTKEGKKHIQSVNDYLGLMLQVEDAKGPQRTARRRIAGINWASGEGFARKREQAFTYYHNLATFLKHYLERPSEVIREDMEKYDDLIREEWSNFPKAACRGTVPFDVFIKIFELETAQAPAEPDPEAVSPATTEEGYLDPDYLICDTDFGVPSKQHEPLDDELYLLFREFDEAMRGEPARQRRRLTDIASYEAIKKCLARKKRAWCSKGRVVGLYDDGLGPLKTDVVPLAYKVCSTDPCMVEDPLHGVPEHDQVPLVKVSI